MWVIISQSWRERLVRWPGERKTENGERSARQARDGRSRWEGVGGLPCGADTKVHEEQGALTRPGERRTENGERRTERPTSGRQRSRCASGVSRHPGDSTAQPFSVSSPPEAAVRAFTSVAPPSFQASKLPSFQSPLHPRHVCDVPEDDATGDAGDAGAPLRATDKPHHRRMGNAL